MGKLVDITGKTYAYYYVISFSHIYRSNSYWNCQCRCGTVRVVRAKCLKSGNTKSCGCLQKTHGEGHIRTKEYIAWKAIKARCSNKNLKCYKNYGLRNITVCDRWVTSYDNFLSDMGRAPSPKHSVERIDNNLGYSPDNCMWATALEQSNNRRCNINLSYNGETMTLSEWSRKLNIRYKTLHTRYYKNKWSIDKTLSPFLYKERKEKLRT